MKFIPSSKTLPKLSKRIKVILALLTLGLIMFVAWLSYDVLYKQPTFQTVNLTFTPDDKAVFEPVLPNVPVRLPKDFAFHNQFHDEEWRYFANLVGNDGNEYTVQWNYSRIARDEKQGRGWNSSQIYLSQTVIISRNKIWKQQRIARGGIGQAGFRLRPFRLWLDNWYWRSNNDFPLPGVLMVSSDEFSIQLGSSANTPFLLNGEDGYLAQHDLLPLASYGFFVPFIQASGRLVLGDKIVDVKGQAWLSKEWSSNTLAATKPQEVRISLHLEDGRSLQLNQTRVPAYATYSYGVIINSDGTTDRLSDDDISMSEIAPFVLDNGQSLPVKWKVSVARLGIEMIISPQHTDMWHAFYNPYWQGPVLGSGTIMGNGVLKITGF
ncbi:lipocalin-like domain-containing protein [Vibrio sp. TH_r3]|uniref:lipocalin-like domain-containing protein n=1 Tax=Vibrio sp. TH_r3 TaxID=3082084 RepID=UPI00295301A4|nr:lipocalin-like domain-containing protein [Vibrio sp. TH_r3]MDV7104272.1 lipocalin-like domain-containing protein [Vibrio sp. TH_r3]